MVGKHQNNIKNMTLFLKRKLILGKSENTFQHFKILEYVQKPRGRSSWRVRRTDLEPRDRVKDMDFGGNCVNDTQNSKHGSQCTEGNITSTLKTAAIQSQAWRWTFGIQL